MTFEFTLHKESLKRKFAVYVVVAKSIKDVKLYVGKTGDNNIGCNPLISRCGNHFSYNKKHSQVRNNLSEDHELRDYTYIFEHFDDYCEDKSVRSICVDRINEMERWLNEETQLLVASKSNLSITLINKYEGKGYLSAKEREKRASFRLAKYRKKIKAIVAAVSMKLQA